MATFYRRPTATGGYAPSANGTESQHAITPQQQLFRQEGLSFILLYLNLPSKTGTWMAVLGTAWFLP